MDKLRSRKAEVDEQLDRTRAAPRPETGPLPFPDAPPSGPIGEPLLEGSEHAATAPRETQKTQSPSLAARLRPRPRNRATPTDCSRPSSASGRNGKRTRNRTRKNAPMETMESGDRAIDACDRPPL